jgi:hypothetical protein
MSAAALTPRVRMMTVCDGVRESKIEAGVFHLKGVRQGITVPSLPHRPARLFLFVLLTNPRGGEFPCYFRIVNERTDKAISFDYIEPRPRFGPDGGRWTCYAQIQCTFVETGAYRVELCFFRESGSDTLKGEIPFIVSVTGDKL